MKLSSFKILVIFSIFTFLGLLSITQIPVRLNPSKTLPSIRINFNWLNSNPYITERDVTSIIEGRLSSTLRGLNEISSRSFKDGGVINLSFDKYTDIDASRFEISTLIRQVYDKLPDGVSYPEIEVNEPDNNENRAFLTYSFNSSISPYEIRELVKTHIEPELNLISDISHTGIYGAGDKEYLITLNNQKLKFLDLKKEDLLQILQKYFRRYSLGQIKYENENLNISIRPSDSLNGWDIPVKKIGSRIIYLNDVAQIRSREQEIANYYRVNGENAVTLAIFPKKSANTIMLQKKIQSILNNSLPIKNNKVSLLKTFDSTTFLKEELRKIFYRSLLTTFILLLFIYLTSRSFNYLLITVLSLISNLGISFLLYFIFKIEIQLYSLAGITLSLGLIIDNTVIMMAHIKNLKNSRAIIPITASTLTTIGALFLINFLNETLKANLIDFAKVIAINLFVSLVVSVHLIPSLMEKIKPNYYIFSKSYLDKIEIIVHIYEKVLKLGFKWKRLMIIGLILSFGTPIFMLPEKLDYSESWTSNIYNKSIGNKWFVNNLRPHLETYLGGSLRLFSKNIINSTMYKENEETKLLVSAKFHVGSSISETNNIFINLENYLNSFEEIANYTTNLSQEGFGNISITFKPLFSESSFPYKLKSSLISKVIEYGGIDWNIYGYGRGFYNENGLGAPVNFSILAKGYNYNQLNKWADTLRMVLSENTRIENVRISDNSFWGINTNTNYYKLNLNDGVNTLQGFKPADFINEIKHSTYSGQPDLYFLDNNKNTALRLENNDIDKFDLWKIQNYFLGTLKKPIFPNYNIELIEEKDEVVIDRVNQEYLRKIKLQFKGSGQSGNDFINNSLAKFNNKMPIGFSFEKISTNFQSQENKKYIPIIVLILFIIYIICSVLFESYTQPLIVLSTIPISFIGVFLTFYIFKVNFDQGGVASLILLSGITVNSTIYILYDFNLLKANTPSYEAYMTALRRKFIPIAITILSTIISFIPFIASGQKEIFWFALGTGTIGGLLFSFIAILFYLPLFALKKHN